MESRISLKYFVTGCSITNKKHLYGVFSCGIFLPLKFVFALSPYDFIFVFMYLSLST